MYLICYIGQGNSLCIAHQCETAEQVTEWFNDKRRTSGYPSMYFVIPTTVYPEKR